jgi:hypothetical protein
MTAIPPHVLAQSPAKNSQNPARRLWFILLLLLAIIAAVGAFFYPGWKAQAEAGAAYGARVGCSCLYVQGRSIKSCETDFEPGMEIVALSADTAAKTATASVRFLASRTAEYKGASGCILRPEAE